MAAARRYRRLTVATIAQQDEPLVFVEADRLTIGEHDGQLVLVLARTGGAVLGLPLPELTRAGLVAALQAFAGGMPDGPAAIN